MSDLFLSDLVIQAFPDRMNRKGRSVFLIPGHSLFERGKGFNVFRLRIEFPVLHGPAVISNAGVPGCDTAVPIEKSEFSFFYIVHTVQILHELEDGFLFVPVLRQGCSDGDDLTQLTAILVMR